MLSTVLVICGLVIQAKGPAEGATRQAQPERPAQASSSPLQITLEASRPNPTAGSGLGVFAELTNRSQHAIRISENEMALAMSPELDPTQAGSGWYASFPSEEHWDASKKVDINAIHVIAPGDSYKALFVRDIARPDAGWGKANFVTVIWNTAATELRYVFFTPGDYKLVVTGSYTVLSDPPVFRSFSQDSVVRVSAPQSVIILGAALGGLLAFLLFPHNLVPRRGWHRIPVFVVGACGASLLGVIATILASRISDTQFFVRVTVNDLWGAVAVGFVAQLGGTRLINRLAGTERVVTQVQGQLGSQSAGGTAGQPSTTSAASLHMPPPAVGPMEKEKAHSELPEPPSTNVKF